MMNVINANKGTHNAAIRVNMQGSIPLVLMSPAQYAAYMVKEIPSTETSNLIYKEGTETLVKLFTFRHMLTKAKYTVVYNKVTFECKIIPDTELNVTVTTASSYEVSGYGIGQISDANTKPGFVNVKKSYQSFKLELKEASLSAITAGMKIAVLNIPSTVSSTIGGKFNKNISIDDEKLFVENNFAISTGIVIRFPIGSLAKNPDVSILTTTDLKEDRVYDVAQADKSIVEENIIYLSL